MYYLIYLTGELMLQVSLMSIQPFVTSTIKTIMLQIHISYKTNDVVSSLESHNASSGSAC